ncbi:hypothetical protein HID58_040794, partial [Brassica napus]
IKLPTHKHPLYPTPWVSRCEGCPRRGGYVKDGYRCYECAISFHKECAEATLEIHHPSHHAHPLSLKYCKLCGEDLFDKIYYQCSICDFVVHTACAKNPPPNVIEYPKAHEHSLVIEKGFYHPRCNFCGGGSRDMYYYRCSLCSLNFEIRCSMLALEIDYPYHPKHPLKILTKEEHHFSDGKCLICGEELRLKFYHCSICKFSVDVGCVRDPPPLTILFPKAHEHQLSLTPRKISFHCDACGIPGDRSPYSCQQCYFMIHQSCIDLPEIINVNRHEHRLSRRLHLKLKGIPEEPQDIEPFKVIDENLICHFSHKEHYLQLNEEGIISGGSIRCEACVLPIYSQAFYSCVQCNFILHKTCANLSRKKRHFYHDKPLTLICGDKIGRYCKLCEKYSEGFKYTDFQYFSIDVKCATISESIIHESHPCTLYYNNNTYMECASCNKRDCQLFSCDDCSFGIDKRCATLPKTTQHWYDEHLIFLCYNKNKRGGEYWCDICEEQIDTMIWFYTCDSCCVTFHTECVLGDFSRFMPGRIVTCINWRIKAMQTSPGSPFLLFRREGGESDCGGDVADFIGVHTDDWPRHYRFLLHLHHLGKTVASRFELATAAVASVFLGFGSLFLLLASGIISGGSIRCEACVLPIYSQAFNSCVQCNFILHKTCANLSRKKRHFYHDKPLSLICGDKIERYCKMCEKYSEGFKYTDFRYFSIDVKCATISESIIHESHPCTLYYNIGKFMKCASCNSSDYLLFRCDDCSFGLDRTCAALPKTTQHWYDEHLLFLCYEKNKRGECWCDICEEQLDTMIWFYTCDDCCVTFHVTCVLGDFSRFMPGRIVKFEEWRIKTMQTGPAVLAADHLPELGTGLITVRTTLGLTHVPVNRYEALYLGSSDRSEA